MIDPESAFPLMEREGGVDDNERKWVKFPFRAETDLCL